MHRQHRRPPQWLHRRSRLQRGDLGVRPPRERERRVPHLVQRDLPRDYWRPGPRSAPGRLGERSAAGSDPRQARRRPEEEAAATAGHSAGRITKKKFHCFLSPVFTFDFFKLPVRQSDRSNVRTLK